MQPTRLDDDQSELAIRPRERAPGTAAHGLVELGARVLEKDVVVKTELDPVCGMPVDGKGGITLQFAEQTFHFCSEFCRQQFERHPRAYLEPSVRVRRVVSWAERRIAYFSMEIALASDIPTYSGGLGVLAGDALLGAADHEIPMVAVTLVHRSGYFRQELARGQQLERDEPWQPELRLQRLEPRVTIELEGRTVSVCAWQHDIVGSSGYGVPVLLLDTDVPENSPEDRSLTSHLYGGDSRYRLRQEAVLGIAGVRMLLALGCSQLRTLHLNEGHAALAPVELLRGEAPTGDWDFASVRRRTVFTTHTPVAAGHDRFDWQLVRSVLGELIPDRVLTMLGGSEQLNMTELALNLSHYVNGVALRHREVSSLLFPRHEIHQITNGVHSRTWTSEPFRALFDRYIPGWRHDPWMLRNAAALPEAEVWRAHELAKAALLETVERHTGHSLRPDVLTLGFARRATAYKRPQLIFRDLQRLRQLARTRPLQIVFAGKAHPRDEAGKQGIRAVFDAGEQLGRELPVVYLANYNLELALQLVAGVDVWLNTPQRPQEASGTSGMKAAHNGVPSLSVLDGWWTEGHVEGATGWSIGGVSPAEGPEADAADAADLYLKLEQAVAPLFYERRAAWIVLMRQCIALNASFFNTHRMLHQYQAHAYALEAGSQQARQEQSKGTS